VDNINTAQSYLMKMALPGAAGSEDVRIEIQKSAESLETLFSAEIEKLRKSTVHARSLPPVTET
jgi:hypothetical protein